MGGFVFGAIKSFISTVLIGTGAKAFIARIATSILLSTLGSKLFGPEVPKGIGISGHQITTRSSIEYRKICYGEGIVSGPINYQNTTGTDLEDLWTVIPLVQGRSEALISIWLDGEEILASNIDWTPGVDTGAGSGTGAVTTLRWIGENGANAVYAWWALGYDDQPANGPLIAAFTELNSNFQGLGITYIILKFVNNVDTEKVWKEGTPSNMKAVIKGRKVYDPRLDDTNGGTGDHRVNDPDTWEWSDNPSLCTADYLTTIMGVDP